MRTDEYQITFDEYREVNQAIMGLPAKVPWKRGVIGWILFGGLAVVLFMLMNRAPAPIQRAPVVVPRSSPIGYVAIVVPGLLLFGYLWFVAYRHVRTGYRNAFDRQPQLHRRTVMEFSEEGVVTINSVSRTELKWEAFANHRETTNTFVLHLSDRAIEIIPKRAFTSPQDLDAFRSLTQRHVSPRESAFPVIPRAQQQA